MSESDQHRSESTFCSWPGEAASSTPATEADLTRLETVIGSRLPQDYRNFLKKWNGFQFLNDMKSPFPQSDYGDEDIDYLDVSTLWPLSSDFEEFRALVGRQSGLDFNKLVPKKYLAIGCGWSSSLICISTAGEDRGAVYRFDGSSDAYDEEVCDTSRLRFVSASFAEFWNGLQYWSPEQ